MSRRAPGILLLLLLTAGCGSVGSKTAKATMRFRCDPQINGGLLLTVDVVHGSEADVRAIRELGEKWFYDSRRNGLGERLTTLTFPTTDAKTGACEKTLDIRAPKDDQFLVVVADYRAESSKAIIVFAKKEWKSKKLAIGVHEKELSNDSKSK